MARLLEELGVPFVERLGENEGIREWLGERRHRYWRELSVLLRVAGKHDELTAVLTEQRHRYKFNQSRLREIDEHERRIDEFARSHGL